MKNALLKALAHMMLIVGLLTLCCAAVAQEPAQESGPEVIDMLPLIEKEAAGILEMTEAGLHIAGRKADYSADDYLNTFHILRRQVSNFEWNFTYHSNRDDWNNDSFFFRSLDENEWNGYALLVRGIATDAPAALCLIKGEDKSNPIATHHLDLYAGSDYNVRIRVADKNVKIWFFEEGYGSFDNAPVIDVDLPDSGEDYHHIYIPAGDFQIVSWAGDFVISDMTVTILD